jgi:hypothetical protein
MKLENWFVYNTPSGMCLKGDVYGNPKFKDGKAIRTSRIIHFNEAESYAVTMNNIYNLGQKRVL